MSEVDELAQLRKVRYDEGGIGVPKKSLTLIRRVTAS
jgi:hypothetical protein